mgnify:CR=1 FL=1
MDHTEQQEVLGALEPEQRDAALAIRSSIANAAGIDERRIIILGVRSGSIIVDFEIIDLGDAEEEVSGCAFLPTDIFMVIFVTL